MYVIRLFTKLVHLCDHPNYGRCGKSLLLSFLAVFIIFSIVYLVDLVSLSSRSVDKFHW